MGISELCKWKIIMKEIIVARNQKHSAFRVIDSTVTRGIAVEAILSAKGCKKSNLIHRLSVLGSIPRLIILIWISLKIKKTLWPHLKFQIRINSIRNNHKVDYSEIKCKFKDKTKTHNLIN